MTSHSQHKSQAVSCISRFIWFLVLIFRFLTSSTNCLFNMIKNNSTPSKLSSHAILASPSFGLSTCLLHYLYFFLSISISLVDCKVVPRHDGSPLRRSIKAQASDGWEDKPQRWGHSAPANFILLVSVSKQAGQCSPPGSFYLTTHNGPQFRANFKHHTPLSIVVCVFQRHDRCEIARGHAASGPHMRRVFNSPNEA